jgi:transposase
MWTETTGPKYDRVAPRYASDLIDAEWALIAPFMPVRKLLSRPRRTDLRAVLVKFGDWSIEIVKRAAATPGFQLLPRRWVVERTLAWLNRNRRLAKDFKASIRLGLYCLNATLRPALSANTTKAVLSRTPSWSPEPSVRVIIQ